MDGSEKVGRALEAWRHLGELEDVPAATADEIADAERRLGRPLPPEARRLYESANGGTFADGNLGIHPLLAEDHDELALTTASGLLRSWDWPVPDELVVFGDNGADSNFGLWLPGSSSVRPVVVELGEAFDDACLAVVGDDLGSFLVGRTAYYARLIDDDAARTAALDALGLPDELRTREDADTEEAHFAALAWASPGLPDPRPDPYERGLTPEAVARHAAA